MNHYAIMEIRRELQRNGKLTPTEYYLLEEIELGTVRFKRQTYMFYLDDLSKSLGYKKKDKIWRLLKSLHEKGLIYREPTRLKGQEILGLTFVHNSFFVLPSREKVDS